ncbi:MAG: ATP-binding protein [Bacteroidia bacterium]|nr:ATP-binding protein [Bacteroidia bacterium]
MIRDSLDVDIAFFYDFIDAGAKGNEFMSIGRFDVRGRTLKFPITEKSFCSVNNPYEKLKRSRVISNPQFEIASLHLETMVRIKNRNTPPEQEHVLVGYGDFAPWQEVIDEAHLRAEWVVCIDPSIDDTLAKASRDSSVEKREIVGFGSGVGLHGELNYTISTEQFALTDVCYRIQESIKGVYAGWNKEQFSEVAEAVVRSGQTISGVSLVKATGTNENYIHDFMAYSLAKKILMDEEQKFFCSTLVSLDAYDHWFEKESKRPDLLWIKAQTDEKGKIILSCCLIECKLALENKVSLSKALEQIQDGFKTLIPAFSPRRNHGGDDERPDQRYWWLQIHRFLASRAIIETQEKESLMASMEWLADGNYEIEWNAFIFAFWSNRDTDGLELAGQEIWADGEKSVKIQTLIVGKNTVYDVCTGKKLEIPSWQEDFHSAVKLKADFIELPIFPPQRTAQDFYDDDSSNIPLTLLTELTQEEKEIVVHNEKNTKTVQIDYKIPQRIFLGFSNTGNRKVFWEFGSSQLHNRHLLVFGASGMGKTYAIQCLLCEMGEQNQNSLVMDYTNGFLPKQLEAETKEILDPLQHYVQEKPLPITPFKLQSQEVDIGRIIKEQSFSAAKRIAGTFKQVYETLGDQQYSCLIDAINEVIEEKDEKATLEDLLQVLESYITDGVHSKNYVQSTLTKIKPFIGEKPFSSQDLGLDWEGIFNDDEHRCHVFQFAGMDSETARLVIEFTLWDLNSFARGTGSKNTPKVIVLDEAQNLDLTDQSPVSKFLTEGRKFGLSLILATQTMQNLKGDKLARLFQAAHKLFFRPADVELQDHARLLAQTVGDNKEDWLSRLTSLKKGECYSVGPSLNEATGTLETKAFKITITALEERFNDE